MRDQDYAMLWGGGVKHSILCFTLKCSMLCSHYATLLGGLKCSIVRAKHTTLYPKALTMLCFTPPQHSIVSVTHHFSVVLFSAHVRGRSCSKDPFTARSTSSLGLFSVVCLSWNFFVKKGDRVNLTCIR